LSRPKLPFEPLNAPRVAPQNPGPPTPINWFEQLAPRLPEPPPPPAASVSEAGPAGVRAALFRDVEAIAGEERRRQRMSEPEPEDIAQMRAQAQEEAQALIAQARAQVQDIEEEARRQGYQVGYEQGYVAGQQEATRLVVQRADDERAAYREDLAAFIAHIEAERQRAWAEMEPQIIGLVFDLARQVIKQEVEASRTVALSVVANALRRAADSTTLRIRVHADDLEAVRAHREDLLTLVDGIRHIEIIEDRRVGPGGAVVETDAGTIDARIETQLDEVSDALERMIAHREGQS